MGAYYEKHQPIFHSFEHNLKDGNFNSPFGAVDMLLDVVDESGLLSGCGFGSTFLGIVPFCTSFASLSMIASNSLYT